MGRANRSLLAAGSPVSDPGGRSPSNVCVPATHKQSEAFNHMPPPGETAHDKLTRPEISCVKYSLASSESTPTSGAASRCCQHQSISQPDLELARLTNLVKQVTVRSQLHQHVQPRYIIPMSMLDHQRVHIFQDVLAFERFMDRDLFLQCLEIDGRFSILGPLGIW